MDFNNFSSFLSISQKKILIFAHKGADVDAVSSAAVLYLHFEKENKVYIHIPEHINVKAKEVLKNFSIPYSLEKPNNEYDIIIVTDMNAYSMLGSFQDYVKNSTAIKYVIDHHEDEKDNIAKKENSLIIENAVSATEVVFNLFTENNIPITPQQAKFLALGLITDSGNFRHGNVTSFELMAKLIKISNTPYQDLLNLLHEKNKGKKIAKLKAASRVKITGIGEFICSISEIGSFEADAASALISLGSDLSYVAMVDEKQHHTHISARLSFEVAKTGLNLNEHIFPELEKEFGGQGGGHARAAAYTCNSSDYEKVLEKCIQVSKEKIEELTGKKTNLKKF